MYEQNTQKETHKYKQKNGGSHRGKGECGRAN